MARETGTGKCEQQIARCKSLTPVTTAVVHPCERSALAGATEAAAAGLIKPIYVGPKQRVAEIAREGKIDLGSADIVDAPHSIPMRSLRPWLRATRGCAPGVASATRSAWTCRPTTR